MPRLILMLSLILTMCLAVGCAERPTTEPLPNGLLLALAVLESGPEGPVPQPAMLGILTRDGRGWSYRSLSDPDSNVFHKAMVYRPRAGESGIVTAGGTNAIIKLWRPGSEPRVLLEKDFGGKFSRMRDLEAADLDGNGTVELAVATHDQGVVAVISALTEGGFSVEEIDHEPDTFVHEIEIGDLDLDGVPEIYATPSLPNKVDGTPQPGSVVRYVPGINEGRTVVAELGDRHAKEILVADVEGDGREELYVSVEAVSGGRGEIVRY